MTRSVVPSVIILAGPNGAGKTTAAPSLLRGTLGVVEFELLRALSAPDHHMADV